MSRSVPNLAIGYWNDTEQGILNWRNNLYKNGIKGSPAGGGYSTVGDLFKFVQALKRHKLLNPTYTQKVLSTRPAENTKNHNNAFGFEVCNFDSKQNTICTSPDIVGHGGSGYGISTYLGIYPDTGYTVIILSNYTQGRSAILPAIRKIVHENIIKADSLQKSNMDNKV